MFALPSYILRVSKKTKRYHLEFDWNQGLVVIVPSRWNQDNVNLLIGQNRRWIERQSQKIAKEKNQSTFGVFAPAVKSSPKETKDKFTKEIIYWVKVFGVKFNRLTFRNQKSKWGSCSHNGNLNFNIRLNFAPPGVREYVIIHELCHLVHHNHSPKFWGLVSRYCPGHKIFRKWLRENGRILANIF